MIDATEIGLMISDVTSDNPYSLYFVKKKPLWPRHNPPERESDQAF